MAADEEGKLLYTAQSDTICEWDIETGARTSTKVPDSEPKGGMAEYTTIHWLETGVGER